MFSFLFISLFRIDADSSFITIWSYYYEIDRYPLSSLREVGRSKVWGLPSFAKCNKLSGIFACDRKRKHKQFIEDQSFLYSYPAREEKTNPSYEINKAVPGAHGQNTGLLVNWILFIP